jgi:hypothetical protein
VAGTGNKWVKQTLTFSDTAGIAREARLLQHPGGHARTTWAGVLPCQENKYPNIKRGGAKGTRTPDLLVANETRYRLRHSPADRVGRSAPRLYHRHAVADLRVSSPAGAAPESDPEAGASAVTGPSRRVVEATPGPDRSMVRTVRGASGFET